MIGAQLGPYRIVSELGTGGMGTVYVGEAVEDAAGIADGDRIALKVVHPQLVSTPGFFKRFLREAEVGKRIRHENVVRTYDVDAADHDGKTMLFLVMEYVEGRTLRGLVQELKIVPEALLREVALQVARGLEAIHAEGVVHRDLKPENVLITKDQQVRIMDLGVAKVQEASVAITREGQFAGSFLYAAPEQFRAAQVGPPADLYSLGVMLYELATGVNPFRGDEAASVIHAQLNTVPRRAHELNPELSVFTAEVLATLLEKAPADRIASAQTLCDLLEQGEESEWWAERERALRQREQILPAIQVRRETEIHGRDAELAQLRDAWEQAKQGEGNSILIEGEPGIGKTRLVDAFLHSLQEEEFHVLYGAYPPSGGLGGLSDAILGKFGSGGLESALQGYLTVTPTLIPAFTALVKHETPPAGAEPLQGDALNAVACHLMRALAEEKPTIWVADELHFAPAESRHLVLSMARAVGGHRILLLTTSRPGLPEEDLVNFGRLDNFRRLELGRLGAREIGELLRDAFKSEQLAEKLGGKIGFKSDGVPFFIFEMIRGLKEGRFLQATDEGGLVQTQPITDIEVPSAIRDLVESRLRDLTEEDRNLLDVAAVQGVEFESDLLGRVCEIKKVQVLQKLAGLERRFGIVRSTGRTYRFDHHQIQEVIYADLPDELREEYHALLAEAFAEREGLGDQSEGEPASFVARHALQGSRPEFGLPHLTPALSHLAAAYRNEAAVDLAARALRLDRVLTGSARVEILRQQASMLSGLDRRADERAALDEALAVAEQVGDKAQQVRVLNSLGSYFRILAEYESAFEVLGRARDLARELGDRRLEASVEGTVGLTTWYEGRYADATETASRQLALAMESGDRASETSASGTLGIIHGVLGQLAEACQYMERQRAVAGEIGLRGDVNMATGNLGFAMKDLGRAEAARDYLFDHLKRSRDVGGRYMEAHANFGLGGVAEQVGDVEEARKRFGAAIQLNREVGNRSELARALIARGGVETAAGDAQAAARFLEEGLQLADELRLAGPLVLGLAMKTQLPGGDVAAALEALAEHESHAWIEERMRARLLLWRATEDREHLAEAQRLLQHLRDHAPEENRDSMVRNVPLYRDIHAAWQEQGA